MEVRQIILLEERQSQQGARLGQLEQRMAADEAVTIKIDKQLSSWINRGIGVWAFAGAMFAISNSKAVISYFSR